MSEQGFHDIKSNLLNAMIKLKVVCEIDGRDFDEEVDEVKEDAKAG